MIEPYISKALLNLKKIHGQIDFIQTMIGGKRYCVDIAQQVNAAIGMLKKVNDYILESHINTCAVDKLNSPTKNKRGKFVKELINNFKITTK